MYPLLVIYESNYIGTIIPISPAGSEIIPIVIFDSRAILEVTL